MAARVAVAAALVGGLGWLVKVALIWGNGGTNTDEGIVAVMFYVGLLGLTRCVPIDRRARQRLADTLCVVAD